MFNFDMKTMTKSLDMNLKSPPPFTASSPYPVTSATSTNATSTPTILNANSDPTQPHQPCTSVELACLSPDHQSFHTLHNKDTIITQSLPLNQTNTDLEDKKQTPFRTIRTKLPLHLTQTLNIDEPLELLCVDNHTPTTGNLLPLLCLYTSKSVFIIQIQYKSDHQSDSSHSVGTVVSLYEPFEQYLLSHDDTQIQRVRSAPQSSQHKLLYSTICNRGALIMLCTTTSNVDNYYESTFVLFHGWSSKSNIIGKKDGSDGGSNITIPATVHSEQTDSSPIVDMVFLPSVPRNDMSDGGVVWNSMSLLFTTENESLYVLSPIVFDNTIYPRRSVWNAIQEVQREIIRFDNLVSKSVECKRSKAALYYLKSIFQLDGLDENLSQGSTLKSLEQSGGYYIKSNVKHGDHATTWPIAIQGPVFVSQSDDDYEPIECLQIIPPSPTQLVGSVVETYTITLVVGRRSSVDYVMIPSADTIVDGGHIMLPRFSFEDAEDREYLNSQVSDSGILVERVVFDDDDSQGNENDGYTQVSSGSRVSVLIDPFMDHKMFHFVSSNGVLTITTNAISHMEKKLSAIIEGRVDEDTKISDKVHTSAFSSIDVVGKVGGSILLNGVIISGDSQFGHVMTVALSDGSMEAMNVTAAMYLAEANRQSSVSEGSQQLSNKNAASDDAIREIASAIKAFERVPSLTESIKPLYEKITVGLSNMSKIVGGSTKPKNVTPGMVATLLTSKQSAEEEVLLPLKEMNSMIVARLPYLEVIRNQQLSQLEQLNEIVQRVQERVESTSKKRQIVENNSKALASRVNAVLSTVRDLKPTLSKAEKEYFKDIDRQLVNCTKWDSAIQEIKEKYQDLQTKEFNTEFSLTDEDKKNCNDLLLGEEEYLDSVSSRLDQMQVTVDKLLSSKGFLLDSDGKRTPLAELTER